MKVTIQAVFPQSRSSAETDKTLKGAVKVYVSTMKDKLSEGLKVNVALEAKFTEGRKPSFATKIIARFGGENNVIIVGSVVFDKDAVKANGGRFDTKTVISCKGKETNLSRWCKKNSIDPLFNAVKLRSIITKFAKESGVSVKPKTPSTMESNSPRRANRIISDCKKVGLLNVSVEIVGKEREAVWRSSPDSQGYLIRHGYIEKEGFKAVDSYTVYKIKGTGSTATYGASVTESISPEGLVLFFAKLKPRQTSTPQDTPTPEATTSLLKALLEQVSVVGARKKPFTTKDLTVPGMTGPAIAGALRSLVKKGTLEKGETNGTYKVVVTPGQLKKLISVSRSKHRSHSASDFSKDDILDVVHSKFPKLYKDFAYLMEEYQDEENKDDDNWTADDLKHVITRFGKEYGPLEIVGKLRSAFNKFV